MFRPLVAAHLLAVGRNARAALAADARQMEENKKTVAAFYDAALNQKDFDAASKYLGSRYTQHNPWPPTGRKASRASLPS